MTKAMVAFHERYHHRAPIVHETRSAFQNAMEHRFIAAIERLLGREVLPRVGFSPRPADESCQQAERLA